MKSILTLAVFVLLFTATLANAQVLRVNTNAGVGASSTAPNADVNANANSGSSVGTDQSDNQQSGVSVDAKAKNVDGWSADQKEQFLLNVKSYAEVRSGQDLENFATGILLRDQNVQSAEATSDNHVVVKYKMPAKFLGIFSTEINTTADVLLDDSVQGNVRKEVTVRYPWYRFFFSVKDEAKSDSIKTDIQADLNAELGGITAVTADQKARAAAILSDSLRSVRASVSASASASGDVQSY